MGLRRSDPLRLESLRTGLSPSNPQPPRSSLWSEFPRKTRRAVEEDVNMLACREPVFQNPSKCVRNGPLGKPLPNEAQVVADEFLWATMHLRTFEMDRDEAIERQADTLCVHGRL